MQPTTARMTRRRHPRKPRRRPAATTTTAMRTCSTPMMTRELLPQAAGVPAPAPADGGSGAKKDNAKARAPAGCDSVAAGQKRAAQRDLGSELFGNSSGPGSEDEDGDGEDDDSNIRTRASLRWRRPPRPRFGRRRRSSIRPVSRLPSRPPASSSLFDVARRWITATGRRGRS